MTEITKQVSIHHQLHS
jgi:hypothetical protein